MPVQVFIQPTLAWYVINIVRSPMWLATEFNWKKSCFFGDSTWQYQAALTITLLTKIPKCVTLSH